MGMVDPQDAIIGTCAIIVILFGALYSKRFVPRRSLLMAGGLIVMSAAAYESYMHFVWEPSVHAPIRLDIVIVDLPLMLIGVIVGLCSTISRRSPRST
jgi:hypothetical protein